MKSQEDDNISNRVSKLDGAVHLDRIRTALLNNHACVMIGSGFSLNAQYGNRLTMWAGLIDSLLNDLYTTERAKLDAKMRLGGTSGMLRLAEEYAAVRGRAQLEAKMHELLPDAGVVLPGELHTKLLALPWTDIYTTNYDTLLERALDTDRRQFNPRIRRQYQVVVASANVPFSRRNGRPRVVKLHGSLRGGTKLIVTEEDYRTYPEEFAPFVNTVQQSMLENVFCLIGFSGDDSNFLAWSGWVRDRLGDRTPPIYFISLNPVSEGQRLVLERRNIIPVNIGPLGNTNGSVDYKFALGLLLDYWADTPVRRRADWPYHLPSKALQQKVDVTSIVEWARTTAINRKDYPGWLVPPSANRERLDQESRLWQVMAAYRDSGNEMPIWLKAVVMDEAVWIEERTLSPLLRYRYESIAQLLESSKADRSSQTSHQIPEDACSLRPSDAELDRIFRRLTVHAMRHCREAGDVDGFTTFATQLDSPQQHSAWDDNDWAALYESLLLDLELRKGAQALEKAKRLANADSPSVDLYWRVRAGAILGEMGAVKNANDVLRSALHGIRERIFAEGESVALLSREQWAERILDACRQAKTYAQNSPVIKASPADSNTPHSPRPPEVSLRELVALEEGPANFKDSPDDNETVERNHAARDNVEHPNFLSKELLRELDFAESMLQAANVDFDVGIMPAALASPFFREEAPTAAAKFCRLAEVAAYVPAIGRLGVSVKWWIAAYRILSISAGATPSLRIFNRASTAAWLSNANAIDMSTVAELSMDSANAAFDYCQREIKALLLSKETQLDRTASVYLRFHMDLMSRVAFRLDEQQANTLLDLAVALHQAPVVRSDWNLHRSYNLFLLRALRLVSSAVLESKALELLRLEPPPVLSRANNWPDVAQALRDEDARFNPEFSRNWSEVVDSVLDQAAADGPGHEREGEHFSRLDLLYRRKLMSVEQASRFARLIYRDVQQGELPRINRFYRGAPLTWPSPDERSPIEDFRRWLEHERIEFITRQAASGENASPTIGSPNESLLVNVLLTENTEAQKFAWSESLVMSVIEEVRRWWNSEGASLVDRAVSDPNDNFLREILAARLRLISHTMHRVLVPRLTLDTALRHQIPAWMEELWYSGLRLEAPLVPLLFAGLAWWSDREKQVVNMTRLILVSSREIHVVVAAINAAGRWLLQLRRPTDASAEYVRHLVDTISRRDDVFLDVKLNNIGELLKQGATHHFLDYTYDLCSSLCALLYGLRYEHLASNLLDRTSRPILREAIVSLLIAMERAIPSVRLEKTWNAAINIAQSDPILPVRNLSASTSNYQPTV